MPSTDHCYYSALLYLCITNDIDNKLQKEVVLKYPIMIEICNSHLVMNKQIRGIHNMRRVNGAKLLPLALCLVVFCVNEAEDF